MMDKEIQNRFLEYASPDVVYDWLERNASKLWELFYDKATTELMLIERKEPIIDLALALFSENKETRTTLYDRGDSTLQKAILTNKKCGYFPALESLLKEEKTEYLEMLLINTEDRLFLVDLFKKENLFSKVKKTYWLSLLSIVEKNKILEYPYSEDDHEWEDDIGTIAYATRLYRSVYGLFDVLDTNNKNAELLAKLVERLPALHGFHLFGLDVEKMIAKWKNPKPVQNSDYVYFHEHKNDWDTTSDKEFTKIESRCWAEGAYVTCRTHLANTFREFQHEFERFSDSEDIAMRLAYYRNENFNWNEEKSSDLIENWSKYCRKDNLLFIENLLKNNSIYWNKKIRDYIDDGLVLIKTYYADEYLKKVKILQDNNPEYFVDNSKIENIELELSSLRKELHIINTKTEENKQMILMQRTTSFIIVFLLVIIVFLSWS